jgi:hypothetical protein
MPRFDQVIWVPVVLAVYAACWGLIWLLDTIGDAWRDWQVRREMDAFYASLPPDLAGKEAWIAEERRKFDLIVGASRKEW